MRKIARLDANHAEVAAAYRKLGYLVLSLAPLGSGTPDLLVFRRDRGLALVEVKTPRGTLTPDQLQFEKLGWPVQIVRSVAELGEGTR